MDYKVAYNNWLSNPKLNAEAFEELSSIKDDEKQIEYRFGADLQFGTAGLRGIIGYGTNMMNVYTVKRATKGLAEYIKTLNFTALERGVVISYDTRKYSDVFAKAAAGVLLSNGIKVRIFASASPVPMLSYAVRHYNAVAGIMITASHNPKEYNGFKVYGEDGAQLSVEVSKIVLDYINEVKDVFSIEEKSIESIKNQGDLQVVGKKFLKKYVNVLSKLSLSKKAIKKDGKKLKIVYTPLHGTGYTPVIKILKKLGINVSVVEEQIVEDCSFSTVEVPNPENPEALTKGIALANKISADVVFGTDPDSDRLGVAIRNNEGEFINLTGNQVGVLLADYVLRRLQEGNKLPENGAIIKSFVTTNLIKPICESYGVKLFDVPVGFRFIGEKIKQFEKDKSNSFIFGFEESCGYLRGNHARDKDAVLASMLFAEMACYYLYNNISIYNVLQEIYERFGYYIDKTISINYQGLSAMDDMNKVVDKLRNTTIEKLDVYNIIAKRDYLQGVKTLADGSTEELEIKDINCIYYELEIGGFICVRPSGTEPKLKVYYSIKGRDAVQTEKAISKISLAFKDLVN